MILPIIRSGTWRQDHIMIVRMWMSTAPITVAPTVSITAATVRMVRDRLRHLLVTEQRRHGTRTLVGIVSAHDLARAFPADVNPFSAGALEVPLPGTVSDIMSRRLTTVTPYTPIEEAARILRDRKIGALPVVGPSGLVGIITESDLLRAFMEVVGVDDHGVRVTFDITEGEDVIAAVHALAVAHGMRVVSVLSMLHDGKRVAVVRIVGPEPDQFTAALWSSGHRVLTVQRTAHPVDDPAPQPLHS
jgi:acetoin utilization protein AcuB